MKNKEITMLELIKLIADDKTPKKIKVDNEIYNFNKGIETGYILGDNEDITLNFNYYIENDLLNKKDIEILDELDEWEDIEEIKLIQESIEFYDDEKVRHLMNTNAKDRVIYIAKINQLIKNQKILKERLDKYE